jgi:ribosome maturation factor RimP
MSIVEQVTELVTKPVTDAGYKIDDILYVEEDGNMFLRIIITKNGIIDVEDCVTVSNIVNPLLDEADLIEDAYILDVCSKEKGSE